ncbi:Ribonuclease H superfamily [Sesbania bispinosa]|nr:Ribonuclease H superfamily [Sesbania bispinosa]
MNIIQHIFLPFEVDQIRSIPLPTSIQEDRYCWGSNNHGVYSVKEGYHFALQRQRTQREGNSAGNPLPPYHWKKLWSLPCQPKYRHFTWRLMRNSLPVRANLVRRDINCIPLCPWCDEEIETTSHLFRDCQWIKEVWLSSPLRYQFHKPIETSIGDWILFNRAISVASVSDRNRPLPSPHRLSQARDVKWFPPPPGVYKINVDAALAVGDASGIGIIARDDKGDVLAAASRRIDHDYLPDPTLAEALGIRLAVSFAVDMCFENIILESDCKVITDLFNSNKNVSSYHGMIVTGLRKLLIAL